MAVTCTASLLSTMSTRLVAANTRTIKVAESLICVLAKASRMGCCFRITLIGRELARQPPMGHCFTKDQITAVVQE
jgi:hypothetical protein